MKTWICKVCGYAHEGEKPPAYCPLCGVSGTEFKEQEQKKGCSLTGVMLTVITLSAIVAVSVMACSAGKKVDNSVVRTVDIFKYQGKLYEIARFNHRFERGMNQCIATYTL